jgi:DNA (cytosine-5)-methyltransferase 1
MRFVDLFAGLGGFHEALKQLGHECVFASEVDPELREIYTVNFPEASDRTFGDIRLCKDEIPPHDVLCAGFPCQPFSKSGSQRGLHDKIRGTLFDEIVDILERRRPEFVLLENVGNFERHDKGRTWRIVRESLERLGYAVRGTEHVASGGTGLLSPHHLGFPHSRERFFIVARQGSLPLDPFPKIDRTRAVSLASLVQPSAELTAQDQAETQLSPSQRQCIEHWNSLLACFPEHEVTLPSFPIWGDELDATYPYETYTPYVAPLAELKRCLNGHAARSRLNRDDLLRLLPSYARTEEKEFPQWKVAFIRQNREWFQRYRQYFSEEWIETLRLFPPSFRKLEWNCQGEERNLWQHVLQFRPSGLRVKRYSTSPSLVAMTSTQIPILGPEQRFLTRVEGLRLQGFCDHHRLPTSRVKAFKALGNAVHVGVVRAIAERLLSKSPGALNHSTGSVIRSDTAVIALNNSNFMR